MLNQAFAKADPQSYFDVGGLINHPLELGPRDIEAGVKAGLFITEAQGGSVDVRTTPDGEKYFGPLGMTFYDTIILTKGYPVHVVDVQGISDDGNAGKVADYTWRYDMSTWPREVQDVLKNNESSTYEAAFKLYDEGGALKTLGDQSGKQMCVASSSSPLNNFF